ncbi:MAG: phosphoribosylamine--glycine ligase [Bacteroidetes bacterium]|nr:phosphoribosylamine--glycine ligase [Bacteroidota bacterium]
MKILIVGNGGRENALAYAVYNSASFRDNSGKIFITTGNPGTEEFSESINISSTDISSLADFAGKEKIDLTIAGAEIPLSMGIADEFESRGLKIFGPSKRAAEIESSKIFSKKMMREAGVPTAEYNSFSDDNPDEATDYLRKCSFPVVIKADGLAAGKGVVICEDIQTAEATVKELCSGNSFGEAGKKFIIEKFLSGEEISVFAVTDGTDHVLLPFSQDHKKISDGEKGNNTGGMGAVAPVKKFMTKDMTDKINGKIIRPVLKYMKDHGREFKGCLYCGLMIVNDEPFVIEFNCRFGDPETQAVLPLLSSDFLELLYASAEGKIQDYLISFRNEFTCCVVLASGGYPGEFEKGKIINGLDKTEKDCLVFHSGTVYGSNGSDIVTNGGRVLSVVGISDVSLEDAVSAAYRNAGRIEFEYKYNRTDIGFRQIKSIK